MDVSHLPRNFSIIKPGCSIKAIIHAWGACDPRSIRGSPTSEAQTECAVEELGSEILSRALRMCPTEVKRKEGPELYKRGTRQNQKLVRYPFLISEPTNCARQAPKNRLSAVFRWAFPWIRLRSPFRGSKKSANLRIF